MLAQTIAMLSRLIGLFEEPGNIKDGEMPCRAAGLDASEKASRDKDHEEEKEKD